MNKHKPLNFLKRQDIPGTSTGSIHRSHRHLTLTCASLLPRALNPTCTYLPLTCLSLLLHLPSLVLFILLPHLCLSVRLSFYYLFNGSKNIVNNTLISVHQYTWKFTSDSFKSCTTILFHSANVYGYLWSFGGPWRDSNGVSKQSEGLGLEFWSTVTTPNRIHKEQ